MDLTERSFAVRDKDKAKQLVKEVDALVKPKDRYYDVALYPITPHRTSWQRRGMNYWGRALQRGLSLFVSPRA